MIHKKRTCLLSAKIGTDSSNYVNHHSSLSGSFICDNNENIFMKGNQREYLCWNSCCFGQGPNRKCYDLEKKSVKHQKNASVASQGSGQEIQVDTNVGSHESQDSDQEIQTEISIPFLDVVYHESELDSSYNDRQIASETDESSFSNITGYLWTMTLGELNIVSFGKKEMTTTNEKIKSMYNDAHRDTMNKVLKPGDMDKRLLLSALFDCLKPAKIMKQYLVPMERLPRSIIGYIKSMETATVVSNFIKGKICILNEMFIKTRNTH